MEFQIIAGDVSLDFINTRDNLPGLEPEELLNSYRDLADWALQAGLVAPPQHAGLLRMAKAQPSSAAAALRRTLRLRECLRGLVLALIENRRPASIDLRVFNECLGQALAQVRFEPAPGGYRLGSTEGQHLQSILWSIATRASELLTSSKVPFIRQCEADNCRWLFLDQSRNHSRRWCDMNVCGNRAKARRFYQHLRLAPLAQGKQAKNRR